MKERNQPARAWLLPGAMGEQQAERCRHYIRRAGLYCVGAQQKHHRRADDDATSTFGWAT